MSASVAMIRAYEQQYAGHLLQLYLFAIWASDARLLESNLHTKASHRAQDLSTDDAHQRSIAMQTGTKSVSAQAAIIPAATVALVCSSIRMNAPVLRFSR